MNDGSRIIKILGITAVVIFVASILVSVVTHYSIKRNHEKRFEQLSRIAEKGRDFEEVTSELDEAGFTLRSSETLTSKKRILVYVWDENKDDKQFQQKMLGVPVAARLTFDPEGKLTSCEGLNVRPEKEEE